eukprot:TRINITY_DN7125_c0_g1_i2.p1 TRINITY_DN7125_c0_g1~~TRINITY_DN7125_c0_g1_i2.p1  ORF type:complete len:275 (+),score=41.45 TRINITY_DN7125_c0_g1_i2:3-827(+)
MADSSSESTYDEKIAISMMLCFTASVIEMASAADVCHHHDICGHARYEWAIGLGVISALLSLTRLIVLKAVPTGMDFRADAALASLLLLLWTFGAAYNTSQEGPFNDTENGYFSTWIAFMSSAFYAVQAFANLSERVQQVRVADGVTIVLIASVIEMSVAADHCSQDGVKCDKRNAVAVAVGVASIVFSLSQVLLVRVSPGVAEATGRFFSIILVLIWVFGAAFNTSSKGPFSSSCHSANGYFATWVAFFASLMYVYEVYVKPKGANSDYQTID